MDVNSCDDKAINRSITMTANRGSLEALLNVIHGHIASLNLINLSTALHRLAKLAVTCDEPIRKQIKNYHVIVLLEEQAICHASCLVGRPASEPGTPDMRCMSIIAWSFTSLRLGTEKLFDYLNRVPTERWTELKTFELSNLLWSFSKMGPRNAQLLHKLTPELQRRASGNLGADLSPQCISTICWAFGTVEVHPQQLFRTLSERLLKDSGTLSPQCISNVLWAFARVHRRDTPLFGRLGDAGAHGSVISKFKHMELSNVAWAFATVRLNHSLMFQRIAEAAVAPHMRPQLQPQNVANLIWSFGKCASPHAARLFPPLLEDAVRNLERFKPQEVGAILWGISRVPESHAKCLGHFEAILEGMQGRVDTFSSQGLACTVEAVAAMQTPCCRQHLARLVCIGIQKLEFFEIPSLCTFLRSVAAEAGRRPDDVQLQGQVFAVAQAVCSRWAEFRQHNWEHLCEGLLLLPPPLLENLPPVIRELAACRAEGRHSPGAISQEVPFQEGRRRNRGGANRSRPCGPALEGEEPPGPPGGGRRQRRSGTTRRAAGARAVAAPEAVAPATTAGPGGAGQQQEEGAEQAAAGPLPQSIGGMLVATVEAEPLPQSPGKTQALPVWPPTEVWPPSGTCGMAALSGAALTIKSSFLTFVTETEPGSETPDSSTRSCWSAPATPTRCLPNRTQLPARSQHFADKGLFVQAAWARLRGEVPSLPPCEALLLRSGQAQHCEWRDALLAGRLVDASWVDAEVGEALAVILQQIWVHHGRELTQCPICLQCFAKDDPGLPAGCSPEADPREGGGGQRAAAVARAQCATCAAAEARPPSGSPASSGRTA